MQFITLNVIEGFQYTRLVQTVLEKPKKTFQDLQEVKRLKGSRWRFLQPLKILS